MAEFEFLIERPEEGRVVRFPSTRFTIGAAESCELRFAPEQVQPAHVELTQDERGQWWVRSLSAGGVFINGLAVADERLAAGDRLKLGEVELLVRDPHTARTQSAEFPPASDATTLVPETVIDQRYRIQELIATGGMGQVYRAVHIELRKPVAVKVMLPELSQDQQLVSRFKREAVASSRIGQQNIIDVADFGRTGDGRFYFVMEYVEGTTLEKHSLAGPFSVARTVHVGLQVARALAAAHAASIIHRDLKPDNIMLVQRPGQVDFVKVLDFGIARHLSAASGQYTAIGSIIGTPQYMAPEQARGHVVDARSDIYSLGLILHELLRGEPAFTGATALDLIGMQINEAPPPLASSLPGRLRELIGQMISKDPTARPQAMTEVIAALEKFEAVPRGPDTGVELRAVRRDRTPLVALGLVAIITLLAGALVAFRPASPAPSVEEKNVQPVPAPAPPVAKVSLLSEPPAEVYEDGALLGMTPLTLSRPPGTLATLEFALKDYEPVRRRLRFETETTVKVTLERKPTRRPAARPAGGPTAVEDLKPSPF